jgi:hypothetical protein
VHHSRRATSSCGNRGYPSVSSERPITSTTCMTNSLSSVSTYLAAADLGVGREKSVESSDGVDLFCCRRDRRTRTGRSESRHLPVGLSHERRGLRPSPKRETSTTEDRLMPVGLSYVRRLLSGLRRCEARHSENRLLPKWLSLKRCVLLIVSIRLVLSGYLPPLTGRLPPASTKPT